MQSIAQPSAGNSVCEETLTEFASHQEKARTTIVHHQGENLLVNLLFCDFTAHYSLYRTMMALVDSDSMSDSFAGPL